MRAGTRIYAGDEEGKLNFHTQQSSDCFPGGFLDQRFERWAGAKAKIISALQRAYHQRFSISAKASPGKPVQTGYAISTPGTRP
jgi:hypothetical protein